MRKSYLKAFLALFSCLFIPLREVVAKPLFELGPIIDGFVKELEQLVLSFRGTIMEFGRVLGGTILLIGLILWASDLFSYKGRRLITAGALLLLILELLSGRAS